MGGAGVCKGLALVDPDSELTDERMPAAAHRSLLDQLAVAGAALRYHGNFDWPGITIGNFMMRR